MCELRTAWHIFGLVMFALVLISLVYVGIYLTEVRRFKMQEDRLPGSQDPKYVEEVEWINVDIESGLPEPLDEEISKKRALENQSSINFATPTKPVHTRRAKSEPRCPN